MGEQLGENISLYALIIDKLDNISARITSNQDRWEP